MSPYKVSSPVNEAIKECGIGYTAETLSMFNAAYNYADKKTNIDFSVGMRESLDTQVIAFVKTSKANPDKILEFIKNTQDCVIKQAEAYRPKKSSQLIKECVSDVQSRMKGSGNTNYGHELRDWGRMRNHLNDNDNTMYVGSRVTTPITGGYSIVFKCYIKNGKYDDYDLVYSSLTGDKFKYPKK